MAQKGERNIVHYDRAMMDALAADFLPWPNPDDHRLLRRPVRQTDVPGVDGAGRDDKVAVIPDWPDSVYHKYVLPGIKVTRTDESVQEERMFPQRVTRKYQVPKEDAEELEVNGQKGYGEHVGRFRAIHKQLTYVVHARARRRTTAQRLREWLRKQIPHRSVIEVEDSKGVRENFNVFRNATQRTTEVVETLSRYHSASITYRLNAELDQYDEHEVGALTSEPQTNIEQIT